MADRLFYGTLRHLPLLECILGSPSCEIASSSAVLQDHAVYAVKDQSFPIIMSEPGGVAKGLVVRDLSETDMARLAFYQGGFDYGVEPHRVITPTGEMIEVQVFFPTPGTWQPGAPWSLEDWIQDWGDLTLCAADEVMAYFGKVDAATIARSFPAIRTRAWARLAARQRQTGDTRNPTQDVIVHRNSRAHIDYFGMEEIDLQHRRHDGSMGPTMRRSSLLQGSAVVVLPYDPVRDTVLLVEQFRAPIFLIDDPEPWVWQPVAGMIDPGETPEQAAHRESVEEADITITALEPAGRAYSSAGSSTEFLHLFVGLAELTHTVENGGLDTEGEDIRSKILPFDDFVDLVDRHVYKDLPLLTLAHWLARHHERLRA